MRKCFILTISWLVLTATTAVVRAAAEDQEVVQLRQRVAELEKQNQRILQMLEELKSRLPEKDRSPAPAAPAVPATAAAPAASKVQDETVRWPELTSAQSRIKFYGFLRVDMVKDDSRVNNPQSIMWVAPEDPHEGTADLANFTLYPRLTRFGTTFSGPSIPALGNAKLSGLLEIDFQNGGSESRPIPRLRHGWLKLTKAGFSFLGGQTWDMFAPQFPTPNSDTLMWNAGNVGDRRPQLQAIYGPQAGRGQLYLGAAIGLSGAVDSVDLDANGYRDGDESGRPNVQGRLGYSWPIHTNGPKANIGFSGFRGWQRTSRVFVDRTDFYSQGLAADFDVPLHDRLSLRGEGWWGRNMSDFRGGIGQNINPATGTAIRSRGGWAEVMLKAHKLWTVAPGYTIDDPVDPDVPSGGRVRNRSLYFANRLNFGGGFLIGADYLRWITNYKGLLKGEDNRVNIFFQYSY